MASKTDAPLCTCHGVPKSWNKCKRYKLGGYWQCRVKKAARDITYNQSRKGRAREVRKGIKRRKELMNR